MNGCQILCQLWLSIAGAVFVGCATTTSVNEEYPFESVHSPLTPQILRAIVEIDASNQWLFPEIITDAVYEGALKDDNKTGMRFGFSLGLDLMFNYSYENNWRKYYHDVLDSRIQFKTKFSYEAFSDSRSGTVLLPSNSSFDVSSLSVSASLIQLGIELQYLRRISDLPLWLGLSAGVDASAQYSYSSSLQLKNEKDSMFLIDYIRGENNWFKNPNTYLDSPVLLNGKFGAFWNIVLNQNERKRLDDARWDMDVFVALGFYQALSSSRQYLGGPYVQLGCQINVPIDALTL